MCSVSLFFHMKNRINLIPMTASELARGGAALTLAYSIGSSLFGDYVVASTEKGVSAVVFFDNDPAAALAEIQATWPRARIVPKKSPLHTKVRDHIKGTYKGMIAVHTKASPFQLKVWQSLLKIPYGICATYGTVASDIRRPKAQRAVGTAIGSNLVGYLIPCHRVVAASGAIGNYRWGTERKMAMIGHEADK